MFSTEWIFHASSLVLITIISIWLEHPYVAVGVAIGIILKLNFDENNI